MAINLWEQAGMPLEYHPMPTHYGVSTGFSPNVDYVVTFKAKSALGASIRIQSFGKAYNTWLLTNEYKEYSGIMQVSSFESPKLYIYDAFGTGDIDIKDIVVNERGYGKSTINGASGFLSGKWNVHANAKVIDDETLELNALTATTQASFLEITNFENGETYTAYIDGQSTGYIYYEQIDASNVKLQTSYQTDKKKTFVVLPNTRKIVIGLYNAGLAGMYTFKKPIMVKGLSVFPYSKKEGDRMVLPVPDNTLKVEESEWVQGSRNSSNVITAQTVRITSKGIIDLEANKTYYLNANPGYKFAYFLFDGNGTLVGSSPWLTELTKIETGENIKKITLNLAKTNDTTINPKDVVLVNPMLYTSVGRNKIPINGGTSGKNMFYGYEDGYLNSGTFNEKPLSGSNGQRTTLWMECEPGVKYALSGGDRSSWHFKNANGVIFAGLVGSDFGGIISPPTGAVLMRVYYSSNGTHIPQIEKGEVVTEYEKPNLIPKKAIKIPKKNLLPPIGLWADNSQGAGEIIDDYELTITGETMGKHFKYYVPITAGKTYSLSSEGNGYDYYYYTSGNRNNTFDRMTNITQGTAIAPPGALFAEVILNTNSTPGTYKFKNFQFEEGSQTSFEKMTMVNKKAIRKNLAKR